MFLALLVAVTGLASFAAPATAATVYEIEGDWAPNTPATVAKGDVVTSEWRINVNDDQPAPSNDPVENVNFTVTLEHGLFKALPDLCVTGAAYDPVSSISDDGRTLVCNLGTVKQGTALVVQAPVVADGVTGDQITASGTIAGQTVDLSPINIVNTFGMDMLWGTPAPSVVHLGGGTANFDFEWTLFQDKGSDAGPNTVTYDLTVNVGTGQELFLGTQANYEPYNHPCTPFNAGRSASGHPHTDGYGTEGAEAPFADCTLTKTGRNTFQLTLSNIDYTQALVPTRDSAGQPLPADQVAVATGSIWLQLRNQTQSTGATLTSTAPTYISVTNLTAQDNPANNTSSKTIVLPGGYSHSYGRISGGTPWDNTFEQPPGARIFSSSHHTYGLVQTPPATTMGECNVLDTQHVTYVSNQLNAWETGDPGQIADPFFGQYEWYVGNDPTVTPGSGSYDPNAFAGCGGTAGWVSVEPADKSTVKATRWTSTTGLVAGRHIAFITFQDIKTTAPIGQDIWTFGSFMQDDVWYNFGRDTQPADISGEDITETPNSRYPYTTGQRDKVRVIFALPTIAKTADRQVVRPGVPATFTLRYSANATNAPLTVDDYRIVDTLPVGMTYVAGSATPEPAITTSDGRQVLTWLLDGVPTNTPNTLTYQAVAGDSVTPGQTLTNTVTSTLRGETSRPASAQVTVSSSGYTEISKSADTPFIPNLDGSGDGEGSWTVTMRSFDPLPQAHTDIIDILPWEGDERGTDYEGSYELTEVTFPAGSSGTVYYTTADPATLSDDPADPDNGAPNAPSAMWSTTFTPDATAVRVIGGVLEPSAARQFQVHIATDGADPRDMFVNRAQGRAQHTRLVTRTSAPMSVAHYYAANLKKYVQDNKGRWHDAQDVADYPAFRYGDTVRYRIVVTNVGQGTITDLDISDDQQPDLGNFHIDSLAPGDSESHEFEFKLTPATNGTVVNTACAEADIPEDSQVPPTINCDPAGFEVANYKTVKSADPKAGSAVQAGEKIRYTVTVTQQGTAPAEAEFSDNLAKVLDDAKYNGDVRASLGTARFRRGHIIWNGTIPVGGVAKVTYSVTVKSVKKLGNRKLVNPVTSPGCAVRKGKTVNCQTKHTVPKFDLKLDKRVVGGTRVNVGANVKYRLRVTNNGPGVAPGPIKVVDRLPKGLELRNAKGKGWDCQTDKKKDKVVCKRDRDLAAKKKAAPVFVTAKATKSARGRQLVNTAQVKAGGDMVRSNNRDTAAVRVGRVPPPGTGLALPWLRRLW